MRGHQILPMLSLFLLILTMGCVPVVEEDPGVPGSGSRSSQDDHVSQELAIVDYSTMDFSNPADVEKYSRARVLVTEAATFWSDSRNQGAIEDLKSYNPDIKVIGYVNAHGSWLSWGDDPEEDPVTNRYRWDWYQATKPYWSYTTTGDTMMAWEGQALLNILDPNCRAAMVGVLADHWYHYSNEMDGVFWDHFNNFLWVPTDIPGVEGQMDLDGDGIPHREDEDEMEAYRAASVDLINRFRAALGYDVIQLVNGVRAANDEEFAGLVDGMMYEHFPQVGFWGDNMQQALDPSVRHSIFESRNWPRTTNGGPYLLLSNKYRTSFLDASGQVVSYRQAELSRVAALLTGTLASYHAESERMHYGWPDVELDLGDPLDEAVVEGHEISRNFERGTVWLTFDQGNSPFAFDFRIENSDGSALQYLEFPAHFP